MMIYRIMIVEDEPPSMRNIEKSIVGCGVSDLEITAKAYNGKDALNMIELARPHIVFSDVKMPVMDGFELSEQLKRKYPEIIIVIVSGYQEFDFIKKALRFELFDYLLKPIDICEFAATLERLKAIVDKSIYQRIGQYLRSCLNNPFLLPQVEFSH